MFTTLSATPALARRPRAGIAGILVRAGVEHVRVALEDVLRAVAVMHVEIHHRDPPQPPPRRGVIAPPPTRRRTGRTPSPAPAPRDDPAAAPPRTPHSPTPPSPHPPPRSRAPAARRIAPAAAMAHQRVAIEIDRLVRRRLGVEHGLDIGLADAPAGAARPSPPAPARAAAARNPDAPAPAAPAAAGPGVPDDTGRCRARDRPDA